MAKKAKTFIEQEIQDGDMQKFLKFCADFGKSYINQSEFKMRLWNWKQSEKYINENSWDGRAHYKLAHNKFSDYSEKEFSKLLGYALPAEKKAKNIARMPNSANIADSIDWTQKGMVSAVQDSGMCGSDWAFSAIGAVEGAYGVMQGEFTALSAQQLLDCTGSATSCAGGTQSQAFDYLKTAKAMSAESYPYNSGYPAKGECKYDESKATSALVDMYTFADEGDVNMMKMALTHQPIAASIQADSKAFQLYTSGVLDLETCGTELNHAIVMVGYGNHEGTDYWIVKNSWGTNWGESGYVKIAIKPGQGICGIQKSAVWTVLQ